MNNAVGIDVSHWQGVMNWATAKAAGCDFAFIKCTQGTSILNSQFTNNWANSKANGIPRGPYHWLEPEMDPIAQANWFVDHCPNPGELPYVLDVEDAYNIPGGYAAKVKQCLDRITERTSTLPMIYTRSSYWKLYLGAAMNWADRYPLWVAHYRDYLGPSVCLPWTPGTWSVWQFTSSGPGRKYGAESLEIDMDVTNGDIPWINYLSKADVSLYLHIAPHPSVVAEKPTTADRIEEFRWQRRKNPRED